MELSKAGEFAHVGKSLRIKGELSGREDLYVDGQIEGNIELQGNTLTVGPNGQVHANVSAKGVIIQGKLEGNIRASDHADLRKSSVTVGDIVTQRIAIEDGAYFKGKVEIDQEIVRPDAAKAAANASSKPAPAVDSSSLPKPR